MNENVKETLILMVGNVIGVFVYLSSCSLDFCYLTTFELIKKLIFFGIPTIFLVMFLHTLFIKNRVDKREEELNCLQNLFMENEIDKKTD